jgi:hypothetical protein
MKGRAFVVSLISAVILLPGCTPKSPSPQAGSAQDDSLIGAWRAKVQFKSGAFAAVKNLEFMYVLNAGGTMTESSNYDASPPVPPAYGVWRKIRPRQYELKYVFFMTKPPKVFADIAGGGGWSPGGSGVLLERLTLAEDGKSFTSTMTLDIVDETGKPVESNSVAEAHAVRMNF